MHSIVLFCTGQSVPGLFNYQIAVRNAEGLPISNRMMSFQITIADSANNSSSIFIETYNQKTNNNGIASFQIGSGISVDSSVNLSEIPFLQGEYYISIAVDTNNGNNYIPVSTTQLISVPYAMVADSANYASKADQLESNGASNGQVLKWNGNQWVPEDDLLGSSSITYSAGSGITIINNNIISNSGDTDATDDITNVTAAGGDLSGTFPNLKVTGIQNNPISTNMPSLGQVLKWDGSNWRPSNDSLGSGSSTYSAGSGIAIVSGSISNTGDVIAGDDITQSTDATTDLSGKFPHLSVIKLRGAGISPILPKNDQILQYINNQWTPSTVTLSNGWGLSGNSVNFSNFIGSVNDEDIVFKRENMKSGLLSELNTSWGYRSFESNFLAIGEGIYNTAIGTFSLNNNSSGIHNTAVGSSSLKNNGIGYGNSAFGSDALYSNTEGFENTAIGRNSLSRNTKGIRNIAVGNGSLNSNTIGYDNVAIGNLALFLNKESHSNSAIGNKALYNLIGGAGNSAFGHEALGNLIDGADNCGFGSYSLFVDTIGTGNSAFGNAALSNLKRGDYNTSIGNQTFNGMEQGNRNTALGFVASVGNTYSNSTAIGNGAFVNSSNAIYLGNGNITKISGKVDFTYPSDGRFKENIKENIPGLIFINNLRPVLYNFNTDKYQRFITSQLPDSIAKNYYPSIETIMIDKNTYHSGFIAQEVETAAQRIDYEFDGIITPQNSADTYTMSYGRFVPSIVKAIQEQQAMIETQNKTIEELNVKIADLDQLKSKLVLKESELAKIKEILLKNEK